MILCNILNTLAKPGVDVLIDSILTLALIGVYLKQNGIQKTQMKFQATSTNLNAADKLQTLYDSYYQLHRFLLNSRNEMLCATLTSIWLSKERIIEFNGLRKAYIEEVAKVDFFVSKETLRELREYIDFSLEYWSELCSLHTIIIPSYNELAQEYDDVYRMFQETECQMPVSEFMNAIASVDAEYKNFYFKFSDINSKFESKSSRLLNKFRAKEGLGSII